MTLRRTALVSILGFIAALLVGAAAISASFLEADRTTEFLVSARDSHAEAVKALEGSESNLARYKNQLTSSNTGLESARSWYLTVANHCFEEPGKIIRGSGTWCDSLPDTQASLDEAEKLVATSKVQLDKADKSYNSALSQEATAEEAFNEAMAAQSQASGTHVTTAWVSGIGLGVALVAALALILSALMRELARARSGS